jgi:hypothetical protein
MHHHAQSIIDPNSFHIILPDLAFAIDDVTGDDVTGLAGQQSDKLSRSMEANWMLDAIKGK